MCFWWVRIVINKYSSASAADKFAYHAYYYDNKSIAFHKQLQNQREACEEKQYRAQNRALWYTTSQDNNAYV